ncbi:CP4B1-like protein [Mya arenaria]|uniref:CP4B1-like protein n=1 Tax=Mya arenaria TaxID=6604 RepID=A0ABY7EUY2_MYAAR|nr:CP4B1-like protein [Mya arenaria]
MESGRDASIVGRVQINLIDKNVTTVFSQDLARLDYLSTCIKEALRLYCPVFFIQRQMTEAINIEGFTIPEGSHVAIDIYNIHHNASMWGEDYDNFRPSRFEGDAARDMDPFAFVPFSAGPRNCIGQNFAMNEMKVVISRLLHRFCLRGTS